LSTSTTLFCHPGDLADALDNAVIIGNGTGRSLNDNQNSCPVVYLVVDQGELHVYGAGRFTMGRTEVPIELNADPHESATAEVAISVKSAKTLQSMLRQAPCGADASASVVIYDEPVPTVGEDGDEEEPIWVDVLISKNGKEIAALGDADPDGKWPKIIDVVDARLRAAENAGRRREGPIALTVENVNRLSSLRHKSRVIDFTNTDVEGVLAYKAGPLTMGIVGEISREKFLALGGGAEEDLWTT
jgi:hypothetical protein